MRAGLLARAIDAGKHVYCEKPISDRSTIALALARKAKAAGVKNGVVQDKLFLPGLRKLAMLRDSGFFGRMLSVRGEFGYWVFEGDWQPAQRPSWNYRKEDGGGIILDMLCHWRYVLDNLFGEVKAVSCLGATHIPERVDEAGQALRRRRRRRRLRDLRARGRGDRADQLVLDDAGPARRPGDVPGGRHPRLGGGRADEVLDAAPGEHAEAGLEPGHAADDRLLRRPGTRCRTTRPTTTASRCSGRCSCATSSRTRRGSTRWSRARRGCSSPSSGCESWRERRWLDVPALEV